MSYFDNEFMQRAINLARKGLYTTDPNPRVGCVLVKNQQIIGEGWHQRAGEPHAEILALQQAGENARGASVYVSLEPCCHTGKTPPCVDALIKAGVSRVVVAMEDPNPLVAGKGLEMLQTHGIKTECGLLSAEAALLNPGFIKRMKHGLPYVRIKMAMSLDGKTAMASGESQWITSEAAREDVQRLRARSSVIMTGINTVLSDDPLLNVRFDSKTLGITGNVRQPARVVLDSQLRFPAKARMCKEVPGGDVHLLTVKNASMNIDGVKITRVAPDNNRVDLLETMKLMASIEYNEVHVEAGAELCGALLENKLVDELVIYMAPHLMGNTARDGFNIPAIKKMEQRLSLEIMDLRKVGSDFRITAKPAYV